MSLPLWVLIFAANCTFTYWVLRLGGSSWLEGWRSLLFIDWLFAYRWSAEQIELYVLLCWLGHIVWFAAGFYFPALRFSGWVS